MNILGIEFAPLDIPLHRRYETLACAAWFLILAFGGFVGYIICVCLLFTRLWWLSTLYLLWIYLDRAICETGGRPLVWIQKWKWWFHLKNYFPVRLELVPDFKLDPSRNYLFSCFPHGVLPHGPFNAFANYHSDFRQRLYPEFKVRSAVLHQQFLTPFVRELGLGLGGISCSAKSLNSVLSRPEGGNIVVLLPGGAVEAYNSNPGRYKIVLKNRKGFIKLALKNGSDLVPVISFGETDSFCQLEGPTLRGIQEFIRRYLGLAPVIFIGRGFFQYSFGLIPRRKPITTLVGAPIEVARTENPTVEQIDELHKKFVAALSNLFDKYKHKYVSNPESTHLEIQ